MDYSASPDEIARLLAEWNAGDQAAFDRLVPLVYGELRRLAAQQLRNERACETLQPTALVHEFYLRFIGCINPNWQNRSHFFGAAARLMRRIVIEYWRNRRALKRNGTDLRIDVPVDAVSSSAPDFDALNEALDELEARDPALAKIVELRYFLGLSIEQTAEATGSSPSTVKREWQMARSLLRSRLATGEQRIA